MKVPLHGKSLLEEKNTIKNTVWCKVRKFRCLPSDFPFQWATFDTDPDAFVFMHVQFDQKLPYPKNDQSFVGPCMCGRLRLGG